MQENSLSPKTIAFGYSAIIVIILNSLLTIAKSKFEEFHHFLATISGHHWVTHGVFIVILFFILGFVFIKKIKSSGKFLRTFLMLASIIGVSSIVGLMLV